MPYKFALWIKWHPIVAVWPPFGLLRVPDWLWRWAVAYLDRRHDDARRAYFF